MPGLERGRVPDNPRRRMTTAAAVSPLFPQLDAYLRRLQAKGARPLPQVELNTHVPTLGPYRLRGVVYDLVCTPGPLMQVKAAPGSGRLLGVA